MWSTLRALIFGDQPGEQHRFIHSWPWPHWVAVVALILIALAVSGFYARERTRWTWMARTMLAAMRWSAIALIVAVMMYGWNVVTDITELPDLVIAVDESTSMLHRDALDDPRLVSRLERAKLVPANRWNHARAILLDPRRDLLERLSKRYKLKLYRFGAAPRLDSQIDSNITDRVQNWSLEQDSSQSQTSRLGVNLQEILEQQRGRPTAAVIVLTDGITTEGKTISDASIYAQRLNIPLYLVGVGDDRPVHDLRITDLLADDSVFVGDLAHFDFRLSGDGYAGREVTVRLTHNKDVVLAERKVALQRDGVPEPVRLSFRPEQVGEIEVTLEAAGDSGDVNPGNNQLTRKITVRDDLIRVLYVQEYPSFEYRLLKNLLERGTQRGGEENRKAVQLDVVLQEADLEYSTIDASAKRSFPVDRETLFQYDVIIFGDANPAFFSESLLKNVADFVAERGGGLVLLAGPRYMPWSYAGTPLAGLMPIAPEDVQPPGDGQPLQQSFTPVITPQGASSPLVQITDDAATSQAEWQRFPKLRWVAAAEQLKPGARLLLEAQQDQQARPLMSLQFVGAGKVAMLLTDETNRWAHHPDGEPYYARFWLQMIRYLSRTKLLGGNRLIEFTPDQEAYKQGESARLKTRFLDESTAPASDDGVAAILEHASGRRRTIRFIRDGNHRGVFRADVAELSAGEYRAWLVAPAVEGEPIALRFTVIAPSGEQARLEMDAADLRLAAERSAGKFYTLKDVERLPRDLPPGREVRVQTLPPQPLWNAPIWPALVVLLLTTEWLLRKRAGML